jgi:hypothetical protein
MVWPIAQEVYLLPFYSWNYLVSAPQTASSWIPIYLMLVLTQNAEFVEKAFMFLTFLILSFSAFYMTWSLTMGERDPYRLIMCLSAGTIALLNPFVYNRFLGQLSMLWGFGLTPLTLVLFIKGLNSEKGWKRYIVLAAILSTLSSINIHAGFWSIFLLGCYFLYHLLHQLVHFRKKTREILWLLSKLILFLAVYISLTAYWVFPELLIYTGHPIFAHTVDTVNFLSGRSSLLNVIRLHGINLGIDTALDPIMSSTNIPLLLMTFIPALFSVSAILFRPKDKMIIFFTLLLPLMLFFGQGTQGPLRNLYVWLIFHSPLSNFGWLLRDPNRVVGLLVIFYAYLSAVTVGEICKRVSNLKKLIFGQYQLSDNCLLHHRTQKVAKYALAFVVIATFFSSTLLSMTPMVQGIFLAGTSPMAVVKVPREYENLSKWLREQDGHFKVLWMPYDRGQFQYTWNHGAGVSLFSLYASSRPSLQMMFSGIDATRFLIYTYYDCMLSNRIDNFGKIISITNTKYVIYHRDYYDYNSNMPDDPATVYESLIAQKDLRLLDLSADNIGNLIKVFKNDYDNEPIFIPAGMIFLIGGLDGYMFLNSLNSFKPTDWGIIYAERNPNQGMEYLTHSDVILFYDRDLNDLLFSFVNKGYLIQLSQPVITQNPYAGWASYGTSPADLLQIRYYIGKGGISPKVASSFDFGLGFVFTFKEGAKLITHFEISNTDEYDFWARILLHPNGGNLTFLLDNRLIKTIMANSQQNRFAWVNLGKYSLNRGEHNVSIINENGKNVVNLLAVVPSSYLAELRQVLSSVLKEKRLVYIYNDSLMSSTWKIREIGSRSECGYVLSTDENHSSISSFFTTPNEGKYGMTFRVGGGNFSGRLQIVIDDNLVYDKLFSNGDLDQLTWLRTEPFELKSGSHHIIFTRDGSGSLNLDLIAIYSIRQIEKQLSFENIFTVSHAPLQVSWKMINPTKYEVNLETGGLALLVLTETYHPLWVMSINGKEIPSIPVYSFLNGFLIKESGSKNLIISYKGQDLKTLSIFFSAFSFILVLSYICEPIRKCIVKRVRNLIK